MAPGIGEFGPGRRVRTGPDNAVPEAAERHGVHEGEQVGQDPPVSLRVGSPGGRRAGNGYQVMTSGGEKSLQHGGGRLVPTVFVVADP